MVVAGLILALALVAAPASAVTPSLVSRLVTPYPLSELVDSSEEAELSTHEVYTGPPKRVAGVFEPETQEIVVGRQFSSTWYVPNEQRTKVVAKFFRDKLASRGTMLYECAGYDCGSSNFWANTAFNRPILLGPEQDQHLFVLRIDENATYYLSLYVALRGTRKLYVHANIIVAEPKEDRKDVTAGSITASLRTDGKVVVDTGEEDRMLPAIVAALKDEPAFRIAVVGHTSRDRGETVQQAMTRSSEPAKAFAGRIIAAGIDKSRVESFGVGPLAPLRRDVIDRLEVVLISDDTASPG